MKRVVRPARRLVRAAGALAALGGLAVGSGFGHSRPPPARAPVFRPGPRPLSGGGRVGSPPPRGPALAAFAGTGGGRGAPSPIPLRDPPPPPLGGGGGVAPRRRYAFPPNPRP